MKAELEKTVSAPPPSKPAKARHELKYVMSGAYAALARAWLDHHGAPDPQFVHNMIHSLYFDTLGLDSYDRKLESDFLKWKIRLRWYTDESQSHFSEKAFLEAKNKEGYVSRKVRVALDLDVVRLHRDPFGLAASLNLAEHIPLPTRFPLIPLAVISYCRNRYIDMISGSRIALDERIEAGRSNDNFPLRHRSCRLEQAVLEVKGPQAHELPPNLHALQELTGARKQAFSKYGECIRLLIG